MTSSHPTPPRASGSRGSRPPSTGGPHPGLPCCSSALADEFQPLGGEHEVIKGDRFAPAQAPPLP